MRRWMIGGAVLGLALGVASPAHAMAPVLVALGTAWSVYQQIDGATASAENVAFEVCMAWAETEGEARATARLRPTASLAAAKAATAPLDAAMGQTPADTVPAACRDIPTGGLIETAIAAVNFLDKAPTPTTAAHVAMITRNVAAKRSALGLAPLPAATPAPKANAVRLAPVYELPAMVRRR